MNYAKAIGGIALVVLIGFGLWYLYQSGYTAGQNAVQTKWDAEKLQREKSQEAALQAYADRLNKAEVQHDKDQAVIDKLHTDAASVRIHLPTCPETGTDQNGKAGVLSGRVDQVFADFEARTGRLLQRCDQLNIDAIRANSQ